MNYWLMKSEPSDCSIDDALAASRQTTSWTGVRNYQARNFMRDAMQIGDGVLFYHSSCPQPGIAGLAEIVSGVYPDPTQFDPTSPYFDPKSSLDNPRWFTLDVQATRKCELIDLKTLREHTALSSLQVLRRGNRLSITPVDAKQWRYICIKLVTVIDD
ncbi:MAG: EVE domain-containing protein [Burkholderiaceae bacterium]